MRYSPALLAVLALSGNAIALEPPEAPSAAPNVEEMCSKVQCAHDVHIVLKREDGTTYDETFAAVPVVQEAVVFVFAGQTVLFEAEEKDGELVNLRLVTEVAHPERTISAKGGSYEMWPYPIFQIALGGLRLQEEGEPMDCVE